MTRLLVCIPDSARSVAVQTYCQYLHSLLGGQISRLSVTAEDHVARVKQAASDYDLVVFVEPEQSCLERVVAGRPFLQAIDQVQTSFLIVRLPRQPIKRILLILRAEETDEEAVEWLARLARPVDAVVTILPIVPSLPIMYALGTRVQTGLDVLLSPNTPSGQQLRSVAQRLTCLQIESTLHLRQGEPYWQIQEEVANGDYDLIVVGAEPYGRLHRLWLGELVRPMLRWLNRPLLIARHSALP